jgi:hypothetical protein
MSPDDDDAWLEALGGGAADTNLASGREARALRDLIRVQNLQYSVATAVDPVREARLIDRARAAGLLSAPESKSPSRRGWLMPRRGLLVAAALIVVVIAGVVRGLLPPTETFRGLSDGTVRLEAHDPLALKQRLIEELSAAGVRVVGYDRLGRAGIDAELPKPVAGQVRSILDRHHIPIPKDGTLVVEIEPTSSQ